MKIAILAPSPVPFSIGGAEKLWWGLQNHLNKYTYHQAELIKLPVKEHTFWDLIESYHRFWQLDLSHFDFIISGKYPGWMVNHKNHHLYMLHCLRGLYDSYRLMNLPLHVDPDHKKIRGILEAMEDNSISLEKFFGLLFDLRGDPFLPPEHFAFPGPFIRRIVHFLDRKAMTTIKSFSAISKTVANRKEYFPTHAHVRTIYPPSNLDHFKNISYDYFFTVSRLDGPKRVRMIIEAYLKSKTDVPLKIAGTGPLGQELKELCQHDPRIEFLGFVSDQQLIDYYAHALAVIFVPYDEDYGLITIEAMMSEKPVITFTDSGGGTEFVENNETGYLCRPEVAPLSEMIEKVSRENKQVLMNMGRNGRRRVESICWEAVVQDLLGIPGSFTPCRTERKIVLVSTYPVYPPRGGGQNRLFYLYRELSKSMRIDVISLTNANERGARREIAPNFLETIIPKSSSHVQKEWGMQKKAGIPVTDIAMLYFYDETRELIDAFERCSQKAECIICAQPYPFYLAQKYGNKKMIYDSQNFEYALKSQMLPETDYSQELLKTVFRAEKECCLHSDLVFVCSMEDARAMNQSYGLDMNRVVLVPNGVDIETVKFTNLDQRHQNKIRLGLGNTKLALFMGSWHQPNIEAVERIFQMAEELPQVKFLILGSVGLYFRNKSSPQNVGFMGVVDDDVKDSVLSTVDVALNPMTAGSGTNMKMLDYMASGVPIVSTILGARGLDIPEGLIETADLGTFVVRIQDHLSGNITEDVVTKARKFVAEKYDWRVIGKGLADYYLTHVCTA